MAPVCIDGGDRRGRSASRHLRLQKKKKKKKSSGSSKRPRLKKKMKKRPRLMKEEEFFREMTEAEMETYRKQVKETGGFGVVDVPTDLHRIEGNFISPIFNFDKDLRLFEKIQRCSMMAIDVYNRQQRPEGKYKFERVLKLCFMLVAGAKYYITFEAKDEAADPVCFQAVVYVSCDEKEMEVCSCRLKPES